MTINPFVFALTIIVMGACVGLVLAVRRAGRLHSRAAVFGQWWHDAGSGLAPRPGEEAEAHAKRVAAHAFDAGFALGDGK